MALNATVAHSRTNVRHYIRQQHTNPAWGWAGIAGLLLLLLYGALIIAPQMQHEIQQSVSQRLDADTIAQITVDGQRVNVLAEHTHADAVHDRAQSTRCTTWIGELICPSVVTVETAPLSETANPVDDPDMEAPRVHPFAFISAGTTVTLTGEVADATTRDELEDLAGQHFSDVTNELIVTQGRASHHPTHVARHALQLLPQLERGVARWSTRGLAVEGLSMANQAESIRERFFSPEQELTLDDISLEIARSASDCESLFDDLLGQSIIQFRSGSAVIDRGNETLLSGLAETARECPGTLQIQGHTDNTGTPANNLTLSQARAEAIVSALTDAGVHPARLRAKGFGASQPVADNDSSQGRAANRRIVVRVIRTVMDGT